MTLEQRITCDQCGEILNVDSSYPAHYGIHIEAVNYGTNSTGAVFAVHVSPPIDGPRDFCGFGCLRNWIEKTCFINQEEMKND